MQFSLATLITSGFLVAACVSGCWLVVSRFIRSRKSRGDSLTPRSAERLATLEAEIAALWSSLESCTASMRRISSKVAMRQLRESDQPEIPAPGKASKAELRRIYGLDKLSHVEIANRAKGT